MTLNKCSPVNVEKITKSLAKSLDEQEREWMERQKMLTKEKLEKNFKDAQKSLEQVHVLLRKCKSWGGPFTDMQELEDIIQSVEEDGKLKSLLRNEIAYR